MQLWKVGFSNEHEANLNDSEGNDSVVVSTLILGFEFKRILVDTRSTIEVLSSQIDLPSNVIVNLGQFRT